MAEYKHFSDLGSLQKNHSSVLIIRSNETCSGLSINVCSDKRISPKNFPLLVYLVFHLHLFDSSKIFRL